MDIKLICLLLFFLGSLDRGVGKSVKNDNLNPQDKNYSESNRDEKTCTVENQQIRHEKKCNLYYRCVYGKKILKVCPNGMLFNSQISNCDSSYNVACGPLETDEDSGKYYGDSSDYYGLDDNTTVDDEDIKEGTTQKTSQCPEKQDPYEPNPLLPHEEHCNVFYKCFEGRKYTMKCPGIFQFDPKVSACDWPRIVRCVEKRYTSTTTDSTKSGSSDHKEGYKVRLVYEQNPRYLLVL